MKVNDIKHIQKRLGRWYRAHHRRLPWRETDDPYRIWIAEVMLQQTQIKTVLPYYRKFFLHFPDIKQLADSDLQDVLKVWEGLGYYARARHLHRAACVREIREEVNLLVEVKTYITRVKHAYSHFKILMDVFSCRYLSGQVQLNGPVDYRWITHHEIDQYPFPKANHKFIPLLFPKE